MLDGIRCLVAGQGGGHRAELRSGELEFERIKQFVLRVATGGAALGGYDEGCGDEVANASCVNGAGENQTNGGLCGRDVGCGHFLCGGCGIKGGKEDVWLAAQNTRRGHFCQEGDVGHGRVAAA